MLDAEPAAGPDAELLTELVAEYDAAWMLKRNKRASGRALVMAGGRRMWMECVHLHIMAILLGVDIALIDTSQAEVVNCHVYCGGDGATLEDVDLEPWTTAMRCRSAVPKRPLITRKPEPALAASIPARLARPAFPLLL